MSFLNLKDITEISGNRKSLVCDRALGCSGMLHGGYPVPVTMATTLKDSKENIKCEYICICFIVECGEIHC